MTKVEPREWLSWAAVVLLAALCSLLAILQYRWIGEIRDAERERMHAQLQSQLEQVSRSFNTTLRTAVQALEPTAAEVASAGRNAAYGVRYLKWRQDNPALFSRIGLAVPQADGVALEMLDLNTGRFESAEWPASWAASRRRIESHLGRDWNSGGAASTGESGVFEVPRFGAPDDEGMREQDWLILDLNVERLRAGLLPDLLNRYLGGSGRLDYEAEIVDKSSAALLYQSAPDAQARIDNSADASIALFDTRQFNFLGWGGGRGGPPGGFGRGGRGDRGGRPGPPPSDGRRGGPRNFDDMGGRENAPIDGRWLLLVRHQAGSLEAAVAKIRLRNMAASGGLLLLIIATASMMVRSSRQAAHIAGLQMNFVAGVSHELRTPLTVIRTAAYNLRGRVAVQPAALERYGKLIQDESEKLTVLVEQVLQFASARSGSLVKKPLPVAVATLIDDALAGSSRALSEPGLVLEKTVGDDLPLVLADGSALRHAIQNLVENAVKYGAAEQHWVGICARAPKGRESDWVEISVADHGPGIPADEQHHIFEAFTRGRRAIEDQIHGTGLGLNLVKTIVEAHGGTIAVHSSPQTGTEFVIRIPAAPAGTLDEFANTTS